MDIYKIGVNLTGLMDEIYPAIQIIVKERLQYLTQLGFLTEKSDNLYEKVIRKDLLQLNKDLTAIIRVDGDKTGAYTSISVNA